MEPLLPDIECEVRTFLTEEEYAALFEKLKRVAMYGGEDEQVTYYFTGNGDPDLRIQRSRLHSKIWLKKGALHDEAREEIELECRREDFGTLQRLLEALGYAVSIKWFRTRRLFKLDGVSVMLDDTKGYGRVLELEKVCLPDQRDATLKALKAAMKELGFEPSPREEFERRYAYYKEHWRELVGDGKAGP